MENSPLEFPSDHPLKVMGRNTPEFRAAVQAALAADAAAGDAPRIEERLSRDGSYVSLTCTVRVGSRDELDAIYRRLHATGLVLFAL